jgi:hypothetical protein
MAGAVMQQTVRQEPDAGSENTASIRRGSGLHSLLQGGLGFAGLASVCLGIGYYILQRFTGTWEGNGHAAPQLLLPVWAMIFLSLVTPFTIIAIRHQIRLTRVKLIDLFARSFGFDPKVLVPGQPDKPRDDANISFEFVKGKYYADLDLDGINEPTLKDIPRFPMMLHADWMLLVCALPFMVFSGFGMFILFAPVIEITQGAKGWIGAWLFASVLAIGGGAAADIADVAKSTALHVNVLTIAALAFAGAYFYTLRLLLRAVATFDLSPVTFLRCFAHMVLSVTLAVVIYRVLPSGADILASATSLFSAGGGITYADPRAGVSFIWLIIAFTLGFVPDTALQYVLQRSTLAVKLRYDAVERHAKIIPLTIIDGIDHFTAFRLEEASIYDVQNLATFNPIMLHIESPYGIYQTIDWVAQAQLCTVVGPDRFILMKAFNIRTIFDLEHAVLDPKADEGVQKELARLLTSDNSRDKEMRKTFGFMQPDGSDRFSAPALSISGAQHMTRIIVDDLHVRRLRQICDHITRRLERDDQMQTRATLKMSR